MEITPSRTGQVGHAARRLIASSGLVRRVVKSETGQRTIQMARAASALAPQSAISLALRTAVGIPQGTYQMQRHGRRVPLRTRTNDLVSFSEVFHRNAYAIPDEVKRALDALERRPRVVDLGANIGMFTLWIADELPGATLTAVEADGSNVTQLNQLIDANDLGTRVSVIDKAAACRDGVVRFVGGEFMHSRVTDGDHGYEVEAFDVLPLLKDADLVKIDIEGAEWPIIEDPRLGTTEAIALTMEWHATSHHPEGQAASDAERALEAAGFRLIASYSEEPICGTLWALRDGATGG